MPKSECKREHVTLNVENLAHWYLRLNGFMMIDNFVLHPEHKPLQTRTDADVFGVRFPFKEELKFEDDPRFRADIKPRFVIAEVTRGECKVNGPWTLPERKNVQYVLKAMGAFKVDELDSIAQQLYTSYFFENDVFQMHLIAFGRARSSKPEYVGEGKNLMQIEFREVLEFVFNRFRKFHNQKKDHQHWDPAGKKLWDLSGTHWRSMDLFTRAACVEFGINAAPTASS